MKFLIQSIFTLATLGFAASAQAQTYPTKPVRFIVPQAPGGASDVLSRIIAQKLTEQWQHQVRPEFTCRFQWRPGSISLWDNRAAMHFPVNDYHGYRRVMHRITLQGDRPR